MQRRVQPVAARIASEDATGTVRPVGRRREPDDEQPGVRIAEPRDRLTPVFPVAELPLLLACDQATVGAQPRAAGAGDDGSIDGGG
jgi:hypothetical protein